MGHDLPHHRQFLSACRRRAWPRAAERVRRSCRQQGSVLERKFEPTIKGVPHGLKITDRVAFRTVLPTLLAGRQRFSAPGTTVMGEHGVKQTFGASGNQPKSRSRPRTPINAQSAADVIIGGNEASFAQSAADVIIGGNEAIHKLD